MTELLFLTKVKKKPTIIYERRDSKIIHLVNIQVRLHIIGVWNGILLVILYWFNLLLWLTTTGNKDFKQKWPLHSYENLISATY